MPGCSVLTAHPCVPHRKGCCSPCGRLVRRGLGCFAHSPGNPKKLFQAPQCLRAQASKLYHFGIRGSVARNTLANANATRDWRIYTSFAQRLIRLARALYAEEAFGVDLAETVYAFDATTIDRKRHIEMSTLAVSALALATFLVGLYLGHRWGGHDARVEANDHKRRFQRILRFAQPFIDGFAEARHWEVDRNAAGEIIDIQPPPIRCGTQAMLAEERHDVRRRQEEMR